MRFHQVLVSASPGDAITNEAITLRTLLREFGPSNIYARHVHPTLAKEVAPLSVYCEEMRRATSEDVIFFHASIGEPDVHSFLLSRKERIVLIYHNITPNRYFRDHDSEFVGLLERGREELITLRSRVTLALADSVFNARELEALSYRDVGVSPLIVNFDHLKSIEPAPLMVDHLNRVVDGPSILFVGQLLPHKRPDLLIQAFHVLATYLVPEAFLLLVGWARLPNYRLSLRAFIDELNLAKAWMYESVTTQELAAFYRQADVFITMSEHEGFCAPVLEAMTFDLPVIARDFGALPETIDEAGIILPPEENPILAAEAVCAVLNDSDLHQRLVSRGRQRLKNFDPEVTRAIFREHVTTII